MQQILIYAEKAQTAQWLKRWAITNLSGFEIWFKNKIQYEGILKWRLHLTHFILELKLWALMYVCKFRNQHLKFQNFFDQTILRNFCLAFCFQISAFGNQVVKDSVAALTPDFCDRQCYKHSWLKIKLTIFKKSTFY